MLTNDKDNDWVMELIRLTVNILRQGLHCVDLTREIQSTSHSQDPNRVGMVKGRLGETE